MIASKPKMLPAPRLGGITNPVTLQELERMEGRLEEATVNYAEWELLNWIQYGTVPQHIAITDEAYILDAVDPNEGGNTIEGVNADMEAWWLTVRALQEHLRAFVELEIPKPQPFTEEAVQRLKAAPTGQSF